MFDFGLRLKELRISKNLSQEKLGEKIHRSKSVVSNYENNLKIPSLETLTILSVFFNVSLDYLVGIDKKQMICIEDLSDQQRKIIHSLLEEFHTNRISFSEGLTYHQQKILSILFLEFLSKK